MVQRFGFNRRKQSILLGRRFGGLSFAELLLLDVLRLGFAQDSDEVIHVRQSYRLRVLKGAWLDASFLFGLSHDRIYAMHFGGR